MLETMLCVAGLLLGIFLTTIGIIAALESGEAFAIVMAIIGIMLMIGTVSYISYEDTKAKDEYCTERVEKGNFGTVEECKYILEKY